MLFMFIEHFKPGIAPVIYERVRSSGRSLPEGLVYIDSWVEANLRRCFQLMECDDPRLIQEWALQWGDLADFEVIPVVPSKQTSEVVLRYIDESRDSG